MAIDSVPPDDLDSRRTGRSCLAPLTVLAGALALALVGSGALHRGPASATAPAEPAGRVAAAAVPADPAATGLAASEAPATETTPEDATGEKPAHWAWIPMAPFSSAPVPDPAPDGRIAEPPRAAMIVPLPIPRPPEFRAPVAGVPARRAERRMARRDNPPVQPATQPTDERSFLEKLFGIERTPALAYAALETKPVEVAPPRRISPPLALSRELGPATGVAVYNIATRSVTLPNGERLEAHSGLGDGLDEPRLVNVRMRGPTPPGTYDLTERESLFHGVRAIRLTPVGGSEAVYGRVGLLAHTFMLGPRGDSNGCVSFRDYDRFLQAFLRGEVQRLVVVTGTQDPLPWVADGGRTQVARNGG